MNNYTPTNWIIQKNWKIPYTQDIPCLNHEVVENLNTPITSKYIETESVIKNIPIKKIPRTGGYTS